MITMRRKLRAARKAVRVRRRQAFGRLLGTVTGVATEQKLVALTFDDGPDPVTTPSVLDVLARHGARGTFFMIGSEALRHPDVVANVAAAGHAIGHHTLDHVSLPGLGRRARIEQIRGGYDAVGPACSPLFRPPYGHLDFAAWWTARRAGHDVVAWTGHPFDWTDQPVSALTDRLHGCLDPGAIILLHDAPQAVDAGSETPRAALLTALDALLTSVRDEWRFVTVPELLQAGPTRYRVRWRSPKTDGPT